MTKLLKIFVLVFMALGFVACDEVSEVVDSASKAVDTATKEGKKIAQALSIEQPLLGVDFDSDYGQYFYIQSQDNNTTIEDIIINRGNCAVGKYKQDYDMASAYRELHPELGYNRIKLKNGEIVYADRYITTDRFRQLDSDSQSVYVALYPIKLAYGKKFKPTYGCAINDIIEVEIIVNGGGSIVYKPKEMLLF